MIPANAIHLIKTLHTVYVARTGYEISYNMQRENAWRDWCSFGEWKWTADDLTRVIHYLQSKILTGERNVGALKFANLIGHPDNFEEDLQLALNAKDENPPKTNRRSDAANRPGRYS